MATRGTTQRKSRASETSLPPRPADIIEACRHWFADRGWKPFPFQEEVWRAVAAGVSGVLHAPTGTGKTLAAWLGAIARSQAVDAMEGTPPSGLRAVWVTPLRALAADTVRALEEPLAEPQPVARGWSVGVRTGDTSAADRRRLRENWPTALVTTPESSRSCSRSTTPTRSLPASTP